MQNRLGSEELLDYPISVRYEILVLRDLSAELVLAPLQVFVQDEMSVRENARVEHARLLLAEKPSIFSKQLREGGESFGCIAHDVLFGDGGGIRSFGQLFLCGFAQLV
jgi:hypothetical protein